MEKTKTKKRKAEDDKQNAKQNTKQIRPIQCLLNQKAFSLPKLMKASKVLGAMFEDNEEVQEVQEVMFPNLKNLDDFHDFVETGEVPESLEPWTPDRISQNLQVAHFLDVPGFYDVMMSFIVQEYENYKEVKVTRKQYLATLANSPLRPVGLKLRGVQVGVHAFHRYTAFATTNIFRDFLSRVLPANWAIFNLGNMQMQLNDTTPLGCFGTNFRTYKMNTKIEKNKTDLACYEFSTRRDKSTIRFDIPPDRVRLSCDGEKVLVQSGKVWRVYETRQGSLVAKSGPTDNVCQYKFSVNCQLLVQIDSTGTKLVQLESGKRFAISYSFLGDEMSDHVVMMPLKDAIAYQTTSRVGQAFVMVVDFDGKVLAKIKAPFRRWEKPVYVFTKTYDILFSKNNTTVKDAEYIFRFKDGGYEFINLVYPIDISKCFGGVRIF